MTEDLDMFSQMAEKYIRENISFETIPDYAKTITSGNIRNFARILREKVDRFNHDVALWLRKNSGGGGKMTIELSCHGWAPRWWYWYHDKHVTTLRFLKRFLISVRFAGGE